MSFFEYFPSLSPANLFSISADLFYSSSKIKKDKKFLLPTTSHLLGEEEFSKVYMSWNEEKISLYIEVDAPFENEEKDTIQLFFDTRDLKTKGVVSRFCHHFLFSPKFLGKEITRFRGEDMHPLCDPKDLIVQYDVKDKSYSVSIEIPAFVLHGYDPNSFSRLGFTYQINTNGGVSNHFSVSSTEYAIEKHPATWGTLNLVK